MGRVGLVRTLKGVILFLAAMGAVFYGFVFPELIREMGAVDFSWLVGPGIAAVSVSAIPHCDRSGAVLADLHGDRPG